MTGGHLELGSEKAGIISCCVERRDVKAAFPAECPWDYAGFQARLLLPAGLEPGEHIVELVFFNEAEQETGRLRQVITTTTRTEGRRRPGPGPAISRQEPASLYLDLLEKTLLGVPFAKGEELFLSRYGFHWPAIAHSMIGRERMRHLRACAETILREKVPGDFMETGVWRGGACILLRGVLRAHGDKSRKVWVADSFQGLPPPNPEKYPHDAGDKHHAIKELAIPLEQVKEHFRRYQLLDEQVEFLKGWFSETLRDAPVKRLAILRLDGDMYESTMDALVHLYPKLSSGGYCIVDDYGAIPACRAAVRDYRAANGITDPVSMVDWTGAWWRKD